MPIMGETAKIKYYTCSHLHRQPRNSAYAMYDYGSGTRVHKGLTVYIYIHVGVYMYNYKFL